MAALDVLDFPPCVAQKIWCMRLAEALHVATVTLVSKESVGLLYEDGECGEVTMSSLPDDVTFHNGLVKLRLTKLAETFVVDIASPSPSDVVGNPANPKLDPTESASSESNPERASQPTPTPPAPPNSLDSQPVLPNSGAEQISGALDNPRNTTVEPSVSPGNSRDDIAGITGKTMPPPPPPETLDLELLLPKSACEVTVERATELLKAAKTLERLKRKREREEL